MAAKKSVKPTSRRLSIAVTSSLEQRIRKAARAQSLPVSAYVAQVLEESLPGRTGRITDRMIRRLDELRAEIQTPLLRDSVDLIREAREERIARL
jgi:hypothetical protein